MPSAFSMTFGVLPSITATHELVVPRSIPMTFPMVLISLFLRQVGRALTAHQSKPSRISMKQIGRLFAVGLATAIISPAFGADPMYPPGARVGMVPLVGLAPAKTFSGFETEDHSVRVLTAELPAAAFSEVETAF